MRYKFYKVLEVIADHKVRVGRKVNKGLSDQLVQKARKASKEMLERSVRKGYKDLRVKEDPLDREARRVNRVYED